MVNPDPACPSISISHPQINSNTRQLSEAEIDPTDHATNLFSREAVAVIQQHAAASPSKPLFLCVVCLRIHTCTQMRTRDSPGRPHHQPNNQNSYLGYTAPHDPLQADAEYLAKCAHVPNRHRRAFCGMMAQLDAGVGNVTQVCIYGVCIYMRVGDRGYLCGCFCVDGVTHKVDWLRTPLYVHERQALKDTGLWEDTVFLFTSDNGGNPIVGGTPLSCGRSIHISIY